VWARTADWKGIFARRSAAGGAGRADALKAMKLLFESCAELGLVHENGTVQVEPYCGSCGSKRHDKHVVTKEPAVLYTHHPTAPPLQVFFFVSCPAFFAPRFWRWLAASGLL